MSRAIVLRLASSIGMYAMVAAVTLGTLGTGLAQENAKTLMRPNALEPNLSEANSSQAAQAEVIEAEAIESAADFLSLLGVSESQWALVDGGVVDVEAIDESLLFGLLRAVSRLPESKSAAWQRSPWSAAEVLASPFDFRGEILLATGAVTSVERTEFSPMQQSQMGIPCYYVVTMDLHDANIPRITLVTRRIPAAFIERLDLAGGTALTGIRERCRAAGFFLTAGKSSDGVPRIVLVANRIEWFPDDPSSPLVADPQWIRLADWGLDLATFDGVVDRSPLVSADRDAFYQLLAAMNRSDPDETRSLAKVAGAIDLLQEPDARRGRIYKFRGTARRCLKIIVSDLDIRQRFGFTHYYELVVFDARATVRVRGQATTKETEDLLYNSYPVVYCTRELPENMPLGQSIHQNVEFTGAFLKLWAYPSQYVDRHLAEQRRPAEVGPQKKVLQISPLLIGRSLRLLEPPGKRESKWGWGFGIGFIAALAVLAGYVRWADRGDRIFREVTLRRHESRPKFEGLAAPRDEDLE